MSTKIVIVGCSLVLASAAFLISKLISSPKLAPNRFECDHNLEVQDMIQCELDYTVNPPRYRNDLSYSRFTCDPRLYCLGTGRGVPRYVYSRVHRCFVTNNDYQYDMGL